MIIRLYLSGRYRIVHGPTCPPGTEITSPEECHAAGRFFRKAHIFNGVTEAQQPSSQLQYAPRSPALEDPVPVWMLCLATTGQASTTDPGICTKTHPIRLSWFAATAEHYC